MNNENSSNDNTAQELEAEIRAFESTPYMEQIREPRVRNADNEWLGSPSPIAAIDEVNGPGASEVTGFTPTRHELLVLARYWTELAVNIEYDWFLLDSVSSAEMRRQPFARRRVNRIHDLLGTDVDKVVDEVYEKFGETEVKEYWEAFLHRNSEEGTAIQDEVRERLSRPVHEQDGNQNEQ